MYNGYYNGYPVTKTVIRDCEHPEIALVLDAPCGCGECENEVQTGHFACSTSPKDLLDDPNVVKRLKGNHWFWEYVGASDLLFP